MALTATQIQAIIDQLYDVASQRAGILAVDFDGHTIRYDSIEQVNKAIKFWESRLARLTGARPAVAQTDLRDF